MYGDSIFYGYTLPIRGWQILTRLLPAGNKITDHTVPGLAMAQIWQGQSPWAGPPFALDARSGNIVIFEFGTNDAYWAFAIPTSLSDLDAAVKAVKAEGRKAVVTSIPQWFNGYFNTTQAAAAQQWNTGAAQVAQANGCQFVDLTNLPGDNAGNTIDGMHRTQPGLQLLFSAVAPAILAA
jgi:lysophospholipase L1-like esterase